MDPLSWYPSRKFWNRLRLALMVSSWCSIPGCIQFVGPSSTQWHRRAKICGWLGTRETPTGPSRSKKLAVNRGGLHGKRPVPPAPISLTECTALEQTHQLSFESLLPRGKTTDTQVAASLKFPLFLSPTTLTLFMGMRTLHAASVSCPCLIQQRPKLNAAVIRSTQNALKGLGSTARSALTRSDLLGSAP